MKKNNVLAITLLSIASAGSVFGGAAPLPTTLVNANPDYIGSFSYPGAQMICPAGADGCGGAFQADVYGPNVSTATGAANLTTIWCVDYQLNVDSNSQYIADIGTLASISAPTDANVRYGNLSTDTPDTPGQPGWSNALSGGPATLDGGNSNSAAYRYTLAAALVSQYRDFSDTPNPTILNGGSLTNIAIQEAVWYITANNDYQPATSNFSGLPAPDAGSTSNYQYWVNYALANASGVNLNAWAVVSGPADAAGNLLAPQTVDGYPSYQTFLVQVAATPEPSFFALLAFGLAGLFAFSHYRRIAAKPAPVTVFGMGKTDRP